MVVLGLSGFQDLELYDFRLSGLEMFGELRHPGVVGAFGGDLKIKDEKPSATEPSSDRR